MRKSRLCSVLAAGLAAAISVNSHAAPKSDFSVCWSHAHSLLTSSTATSSLPK